MGEDVKVVEYSIGYKSMSLKLQQDLEILYDCMTLIVHISELNKGFRVKRFGKATRKGTNVRYSAIKTHEELLGYVKMLVTKFKEVVEKWESRELNENEAKFLETMRNISDRMVELEEGIKG